MKSIQPEGSANSRIALISAPWPLFDRPSIQLGALKAFVEKGLSDVRVDTFHLYLRIARAIGYPLYHVLSERSWLAEAPYAGLLYPDRMDKVIRYWKRKGRGHPLLRSTDFEDLCRQIGTASREAVESVSWGGYLLVGFSICLAQLTSSLYFIREIRRRAPRVRIIAGGSACAGALGESLIQAIPEIDDVIRGEGELPLLQLAKAIRDCPDCTGLPHIPGLVRRGDPPTGERTRQVPTLDELPVPDYTDYFRDLASFGPHQAFLPKLPLEMSRGCWWNQGGKGCAFCNLNLQWQGYRAKTSERMVREIETLVARHQVLSASFMDNLLPARGLEERFEDIRGLGLDLRLFSEIRARTSRAALGAMASAGMKEVQVGIEALSTRLLKKLNKGTTAMDNLEIMKHCESPHLPDLTGNLILGFPSSDSQDVAETLHHLDFAFPFRPLKGIELWLGYGSPLWQHPDRYGIRVRGNHGDYRHLFPPEKLERLQLMMRGYEGSVTAQRRLWAPVRKKLSQWRAYYDRMHQAPGFEPILSFRDGKTFLIIWERRPDDEPMTHRLKGTSRAIYLFCETQRPMAQILARFPQFGEDQMISFLRMMVDKRLMFREGDRYLALAVSQNPFRSMRA